MVIEFDSEKCPGEDMVGFRIQPTRFSAAPTSSIRVMQAAYGTSAIRAIRQITHLRR